MDEEEREQLLIRQYNCECKNGGKPKFDMILYTCKCECTTRFQGKDCGECAVTSQICKKRNGFLDKKNCNCKCNEPACYNNGYIRGESTSDALNDCRCTCLAPYIGRFCDICALKSCKNNGFPDIHCRCRCPKPFTGAFCEGVKILIMTRFFAGITTPRNNVFSNYSQTGTTFIEEKQSHQSPFDFWVSEYMLQLSSLLSNIGHKVTILYTNLDPNQIDVWKSAKFLQWKNDLEERGIYLVSLRDNIVRWNEEVATSCSNGCNEKSHLLQLESFRAYEWLSKHEDDYDMIQSHDYGAIGYYLTMAQRAGLLFKKKSKQDDLGSKWMPKLFVHAIGTRWHQLREIENESNENLRIEDFVIKKMETYTLQHADHVISNSYSYVEWINKNHDTNFQISGEKNSQLVILPPLIDANHVNSNILLSEFMFLDKLGSISFNKALHIIHPIIDINQITILDEKLVKLDKIVIIIQDKRSYHIVLSLLTSILKNEKLKSKDVSIIISSLSKDHVKKIKKYIEDMNRQYLYPAVRDQLAHIIEKIQYFTLYSDMVQNISPLVHYIIMIPPIHDIHLYIWLTFSTFRENFSVLKYEKYLPNFEQYPHYSNSQILDSIDKLVKNIEIAFSEKRSFQNKFNVEQQKRIETIQRDVNMYVEWHDDVFKSQQVIQKHKLNAPSQISTSIDEPTLSRIPVSVIVAFQYAQGFSTHKSQNMEYIQRLIGSLYRQIHNTYSVYLVVPEVKDKGVEMQEFVTNLIQQQYKNDVFDIHVIPTSNSAHYHAGILWQIGINTVMQLSSKPKYLLLLYTNLIYDGKKEMEDEGSLIAKPNLISEQVSVAESTPRSSQQDVTLFTSLVDVISDRKGKKWDQYDKHFIYSGMSPFSSTSLIRNHIGSPQVLFISTETYHLLNFPQPFGSCPVESYVSRAHHAGKYFTLIPKSFIFIEKQPINQMDSEKVKEEKLQCKFQAINMAFFEFKKLSLNEMSMLGYAIGKM